MLNQYFLGLFFLLSVTNVWSQTGKGRGYIMLGDTAYKEGTIHYNVYDPREVSCTPAGGEQKSYRAGEVTEFFIRGEDKYLAREVSLAEGEKGMRFLKVVEEGEVTFLKSRAGINRFYLEADSLVPLTRKNYQGLLSELNLANGKKNREYQKVRYNRKSMAYFFRHYNKGSTHRTIPVVSFGPAFQFGRTRWHVPGIDFMKYSSGSFTSSHNTPARGIFVFFPTWQTMSWGVEFLLTHQLFSSVSTTLSPVDHTQNNTWYTQFEMESVQLDILPKYTLDFRRIKPYFYGGIGSRFMLDRSNNLIFSRPIEAGFEFHYLEDLFENPGFLAGITLGQGFQLDIIPRTYLAAEWGYTHLWNLSDTGYYLTNLFFTIKLNLYLWHQRDPSF